MRETRIYKYHAFGYNYSLLRLYEGNEPVQGGPNSTAGRIQSVLSMLEELGLRVTLQAASKLRVVLGEALALPPDTVAVAPLVQRVRDAVEEIDVTLDAELNLTTAFVVTPKRYSVEHLLIMPSNLLGENVFASLSQLSQFDFTEACRCIAFERPTAGAFHLMRCAEGTLKSYYCTLVKRDRVKQLMWYAMVEHMGKRRDAPPKPLLDNLQSIRTNFRNPTQHPDARYDMDEAQDLLAVTIDAINRMTRDLAKRSSGA